MGVMGVKVKKTMIELQKFRRKMAYISITKPNFGKPKKSTFYFWTSFMMMGWVVLHVSPIIPLGGGDKLFSNFVLCVVRRMFVLITQQRLDGSERFKHHYIEQCQGYRLVYIPCCSHVGLWRKWELSEKSTILRGLGFF